MRTRVFSLVAVVLVAAMSSCGGSNDEGSTEDTTTTTGAAAPGTQSSALPVTDAAKFRDNLLRISSTTVYVDPATAHEAVFRGWTAAFPGLRIASSVSEADPSSISAYNGFGLDKKSGHSLLPFAVKDTQGRCALGVIARKGQDLSPWTVKALEPAPAKCSANPAGFDSYRP